MLEKKPQNVLTFCLTIEHIKLLEELMANVPWAVECESDSFDKTLQCNLDRFKAMKINAREG